ncbi:MAG: hypothetical protein IJJ11_07895 [Methanosphaera sp.]|nr:hypothetical protein [Methanobrevibacter sp.]MBQ6444577.1 hypothetical protein [Methanosphaera sp.]
MNSQGYKLTSELDKGLKKYGEVNNLSPSFIINDLVEAFLIDKGYLSVHFPVNDIEIVPEKIKYAHFQKKHGRYIIQKSIQGKRYYYASVTQGAGLTKEIIQFLESKEWDVKYATSSTGLKGVDQINFLLNEMEKRGV